MMLRTRKMGLIAILFCLTLACGTVRAQEIPARTQGASLQAFGLISYVQPHYDTANNIGGSFGADLNFRPFKFLQPSVELRATFAPGSDVSETTYDFGPRVELDLGRLKPYGYFLIGPGKITFAHPVVFPTGPYAQDNSLVYSGGIGADYMLSSQIGLRGDLMVQSWNLGGQGDPSTTSFNPRLFSFGIDYRFDFNRVRHNRH
jgi:hypothetical protein